ncbi:MAG: hypothetical protein GWN71_22360, partial [Gammaproteobacteria bacterium]|nr:hypothetical protein [Gemmatimonadota bacterium]NIU76203.1 hypothetical protein [Gammaproteobacteria bacterium]
PADIGNRSFLDGGLRSVLPLEVARKFRPDWVFGVRVGPVFGELPPGDVGRLPPLLRTHNFAMRILMAAQTEREIERFRSGGVPLVLVEPELEEGTTFDVGGAVAYVEAG